LSVLLPIESRKLACEVEGKALEISLSVVMKLYVLVPPR